jgi:hypothetical protein
LLSQISLAGKWLLGSGIQEHNGGVARYYRSDLGRNHPISTEITGYAASAFVYLHSLTGDAPYLDAAVAAAQFLARTAWNPAACAMPFEMAPAAGAYFFDCGIIVRGLLAVWRASGSEEFLNVAAALGRAMALDFEGEGGFHPILSLPAKLPEAYDSTRWSRSPGCYQLKSAMAWCDLAEVSGEARFAEMYRRALGHARGSAAGFLPGAADSALVMDRLHAYLYFLEGLLPAAREPECAADLRAGIFRVADYLRQIAPEFERSDVYAQLLRLRVYADWAGASPLDLPAAQWEAEQLAAFQAQSGDRQVAGGFCFGRRKGAFLPHINPVSTAFAVQALALWDGCRRGGAQPHRHLLI